MTVFDFISLFGGLALFLYGMRLMGDGLQQGSSGTLKKFMEKVANNPFTGFLLGLCVTAVIQSSTATIVLTSGLVGAGILSLRQSIGIILGANVGTTVTGQIIRLLDIDGDAASWLNIFKPSTLAPVSAIIGIVVIMALSSTKSDIVGKVAMGFGILFTGLLNMTAAVAPLSESETFSNLFIQMSNIPILGFLVGTGAAFLIQSSSATIGILQALSMTGALTFSSVYAIIIGVNMGDCITTAIVCSIGSKADAKRTGMIHILFNIAASILVITGIFILHHAGVLDSIWDARITSGGIANAHTLFRLFAAIVLLPVSLKFEKLSRLIIKDDKYADDDIEAEIQQLDEKLFVSPALALSSISSVISKMASLSIYGVKTSIRTLRHYDADAINEINHNEDDIDLLADKVDNYMIKFSPQVPVGPNSKKLNYYIQCFSEFERIGDYATNIAETSSLINEKKIEFSMTAHQELAVLGEAIAQVLDCSYKAFTKLDVEAAKKIEPIEEVIDDLVSQLRSNHIDRFNRGECSVHGGITYLDILVNVERISDQCSNIGINTLALLEPENVQNQHDYTKHLHGGNDENFNKLYKKYHDKYFNLLVAPDYTNDF
jgi:phosphate:Na+ symporter